MVKKIVNFFCICLLYLCFLLKAELHWVIFLFALCACRAWLYYWLWVLINVGGVTCNIEIKW